MSTNHCINLNPQTSLQISPNNDFSDSPFAKKAGWYPVPESLGNYEAYTLIADVNVLFDESVSIRRKQHLYLKISAGLATISDDGLELIIFMVKETHKVEIFRYHLKQNQGQSMIDFDTLIDTDLSGKLLLECNPGPENNANGDWLVIHELMISLPEEMPLIRARSMIEKQVNDQVYHFSKVYQDEANQHNMSTIWQYMLEKKSDYIKGEHIDFTRRMSDKAENKPCRILSLCSGLAQIEVELLKTVTNDNVSIELYDINEELLQLAILGFNKNIKSSYSVIDVNGLSLTENSFDIILCVSGLHHLVELEHITAEIAKGLTTTGEFWSIGEYVGRNGAMLWDASYLIANQFFSSLPERYRINHVSHETPHLDQSLPNIDCSDHNFEGIRSEDIEGCLAKHLQCVQTHHFDVILWRLLDYAYMKNYSLDKTLDKIIIDMMIALDFDYFQKKALKPVSFNAIYKQIKSSDI